MIWRVTSLITGTPAVGGGISRLYFAPTAGTPSDATNAVKAFWLALAPRISSAVTIQTVAIVDQVDETTGQITGQVTATGGSQLGSNGGAIGPVGCQGLIQWRTGFYTSGREVRGRLFVPGVTASDVSSGLPSSTYLTGLDSAGDALVADVNSQLLVWSKTHGVAATVSSTTPWTKFAFLRSRRD